MQYLVFWRSKNNKKNWNVFTVLFIIIIHFNDMLTWVNQLSVLPPLSATILLWGCSVLFTHSFYEHHYQKSWHSDFGKMEKLFIGLACWYLAASSKKKWCYIAWYLVCPLFNLWYCPRIYLGSPLITMYNPVRVTGVLSCQIFTDSKWPCIFP